MKTTTLLIAVFILCLSLAGCKQNGTSDSQPAPAETASAAIRVSRENADAAEPAIAADIDGNIYALFVEHNADKTADIYLQKFDAGLKPLGSPVRIDPKPGSVKAWRGDPPTIVIGNDKKIYVGWTRKLNDERVKGNDLLLSVSHDGGTTFADPVKVNDDTKPASHGMHALAVDNENRIYLSWLDERHVAVKPHATASMTGMHHESTEPNSEVFYAVSNDGGKTFSANKKIAAEACPCCKTSLLASPGGNVYVSWRQVLPGDLRHVAVAGSSDRGLTFSPSVIVSDDNWQLSACPVSGAALSGDGEKLSVLWYTAGAAGQAGLYLATSSDGGRSFAHRELIDPAATNGTPVLVRSGSGVLLMTYSLNGGKIAVGERQQNGEYAVKKSIDQSSLPAAVISDGRLVTLYVKAVGQARSVWLER